MSVPRDKGRRSIANSSEILPHFSDETAHTVCHTETREIGVVYAKSCVSHMIAQKSTTPPTMGHTPLARTVPLTDQSDDISVAPEYCVVGRREK